MKRYSYREHNARFGQLVLTLRSKIGFTQAGLAEILDVSRHSVADWESGEKYPKAEHLKHLIEFAFRQRAFHTGFESTEIRTLWEAAQQKIPLDESWFAALLGRDLAPLTLPAETNIAVPSAIIPVLIPPAKTPRVDWKDALTVPAFYGREQELSTLTGWLTEERCRVIGLLGMGGIGKSAISINLMHQVANDFDVVIWRSVRDAPHCEALLDDCIRFLAPQLTAQPPTNLEQRITLLLEYMRRQRVLLILDNMETLLEEGEQVGRVRSGYEGYEKILTRVGETSHQSCVIFTSREKPVRIAALEGNHSPVRTLRLSRLESKPCEQLLAEKGVHGSAGDQAHLIDTYAGNALALKIVAQTIVDLFDGEIGLFLEQGEIIFGSIRKLLAEQFVRLSALEQSVLLWLAIMREPSSLDELSAFLLRPVSRMQLFEAIDALHRRSLIERGQKQGTFTLQSVVLEYITARLIEEMIEAIQGENLQGLVEHRLVWAKAREYVRKTQERLIVAPLLAYLERMNFEQAGVEKSLLHLIAKFRLTDKQTQGYGPSNLVTLLRVYRGHLRGLDLGGLELRGIYLQGIDMQDTSLRNASIQDCVFSESFDAITAVAMSPDGKYWAAASRRGEIRIWDEGGQILRNAWRAHTNMIWTLSFSPDGRTIASGSWDGAVKLWDVASGRLIWASGHFSHTNRVAFSPDGSIVASAGNDMSVRFWDARNGVELQTLSHPCPVAVVNWSPDGSLLVTGDLQGSIRLWHWNGNQPATCINTLLGHINCVDTLAFSPDGQTLASSSWDSFVKLWDADNGNLLHTLSGHTDRVFRVAWSPDGCVLASGGRDKAIWLWDVQKGEYRAVLHGHDAVVDGLNFTPDSRSLLSGSEDGTLRVWDIDSLECVQVIEGYAASLYDIDWSPDGTQLVSGGSDGLVTVHDLNSDTPLHVLRGHISVVFGVAWSRTGQWLASVEWGHTIRLWNPNSGEATQILRHPEDEGTFFCGLAWSADGLRLVGATYQHGVQVFNMTPQHQSWTKHNYPIWIRPVAWSPDGAQLAGGGDDGILYIWETTGGSLLHQFEGHHSMITTVAWNVDGTRLVSSSSGELLVWDVQSGECISTITDHPGTIYDVIWGPGEDVIVSGGSDGSLRWWNIRTGDSLWECEAHAGTIRALRQSPDGTCLASCGDDGAIKLWDLQTGELIRTLRRDRPYERLDITGIDGLTGAQQATLYALGATIKMEG